MTTFHLLRFPLILITIFFCQCLYGQHAIFDLVDQNLTEIQKTNTYAPLLEVEADRVSIPKNVLTKAQVFELDQTTVQSIRNNNPKHLRINIPIEGQMTELQLVKAQIFGPDFQAELSSNPGVAVDIDRGNHYWGIVGNESESLVSFSFYNEEIIASISFDGQQYTLGEMKNTDYHVLYNSQDLKHNSDFSCDAILPPGQKMSTELMPVQKSAVDNCLGIHIEADYSFYLSASSNVNTATSYITAVFAQSAILYANESISVYLSFLNVWNTPSPFGAGTELDDLMAQGYGTSNGTLVHLIHTNGAGGVAYVNVLCNNSFNVGVSGFIGGFQNVPTYSWDVEVFTHEIGHNLGSPHTHACAWNGNNTAIDGCGPASGNDEGCDPGLPASGTIMSYCHLVNGVGIDFNLGFGTQPGNLIRNRVANASCLDVCAACDDSLQNGDESGVDCGGANCQACPCASGTGVSLIMNTDNFVSETTWEFADLSGNVVASGGPYPDGVKTIIEPVCLPPGCYDFTIYDSYGDGLFDGNTTGDYTVIDDAGNVFASGVGNFGAQETSNFCTSTACAGVDLNINFDGFPTQTTWDIEDTNGNVVASGNGNGQNGNSNTSENTCLPDGCYTLNFYDSINNGMCPFRSTATSSGTFITSGTIITPGTLVATLGTVVAPGLCGNYTLTDANGAVLASGGGGFGAQQSRSFCLSGGTASLWNEENNSAYQRRNESTGLNVFPTLAKDNLSVQYLSETSEPIQINIVDINGQIIQQYEQSIPQMQINVSDLPTGIYFIQMITNDSILVEKFVKK